MRLIAPCGPLVLAIGIVAKTLPAAGSEAAAPKTGCLAGGQAIAHSTDRLTAPPAVPAGLVEGLIDWIEGNTNYDIAATRFDPPNISFCYTGESISYEGENVVVEEDLRAVFDVEARNIFLVEPWNSENLRDQSRLLHELVHDVQLTNRHYYCVQESEWEAYKLQDQWLAERGIESGFDWLLVFFLSRCPRDIHP